MGKKARKLSRAAAQKKFKEIVESGGVTEIGFSEGWAPSHLEIKAKSYLCPDHPPYIGDCCGGVVHIYHEESANPSCENHGHCIVADWILCESCREVRMIPNEAALDKWERNHVPYVANN